MALRFLLDEHLRGPLWHAIQRHNLSSSDSLDVVRVGDPADLPLGSDDPTILAWAERFGPDYRRLFYHFGVNHVSHVSKRGRVVLSR